MGYKFIGETTRDEAGFSAASAGDADGDGRDDLIIGALRGDANENGAGESYLITAADLISADAADGSADGEIDLGNIAALASSYKFIGGSVEFAAAGWSVSSAGDLENDGQDDLLIGAPGDNAGGVFSGAAYLISTANLGSADSADGVADGEIDLGNIALQPASYKFIGEEVRGFAGSSVASAGDVDGDGHDDFLIGNYLVAFADLTSADAADGTTDGEIELGNIALEASSYKFVGDVATGRSVASAGDFDGDGKDDLIMGRDDGKSYLIATSDLAAADASDGTTDGEIDYNNIAAQANSYEFTGGYGSGYSVALAGDTDGDGRNDIIIGAYLSNSGGTESGESHLIAAADLIAADSADGVADGKIDLGNIASLNNSYNFIGEDLEDRSGVSVTSVGDIDGDGLDDLMIGTLQSFGDVRPGSAYLIMAADLADADTADGSEDGRIDLGNVAPQAGSYKFIGEDPRDVAGSSVASAGDIDGDGRNDLLITALRGDGGGADSGEVYLVFASELASADAADGVVDGLIHLAEVASPQANGTVLGTSGDDVINAGYVDMGGDEIDGGDGPDDIVLALAGNDTVNAGIGADSVDGGDGDDVLRGQGGADVLDGGDGRDTLWGGTDTDTLNGGSGDDFLYGQNGDDRLLGNGGADRLYGGAGDDTLSGGADDDRLFGQTNNDVLRGNDGADALIGADGNDSLGGGAGDDRLIGGRDDDTLDGGAGADLMLGSSGSDTFVFAQGYETDRVNQYEQGIDALSLDDALWGGGLTGQQVVDTYGTSNATGSILTLDFGGGDVLEVQNRNGIDATTLGADIAIF